MSKMGKLFSLMAAIALVMVSQSVWAEDAKPAATPAAPAIVVGGMVDTYYTYNFTNSSVRNGSGNVWTSPAPVGVLGSYFNTQDETFALGMAELKATATQGDASAHLVLNYGQEGSLGLGSVQGIDVLQAYVSLAAGQWGFNLGRFATWMGNEVIESNGNWNYSRSELFWATIPLWHQGLSVSFNPDTKIGATLYAVDGWNNTGVMWGSTGQEIGKTYGLQIALHPDASLGIILNGIVGPGGSLAGIVPGSITLGNPAGNPEDPADARYVGELIVSLAATDKLSLALDAEYFGQDQDVPIAPATTNKSLTGWGVDLYGRYQIESDWAAALRLEEVYDDNGYIGIGGTPAVPGPGVLSGEVRDMTLTIEHNFTPNLLARLEGRIDMEVIGGTQTSSTAAPFGPYAGNGSGTQTTGTASAVFSF